MNLYLEQLPIEWIEQLHYFALRGSDDPILQLIEQLPGEQSPLAQALTEWVDNFQFDEILHLVQPLLS